MPRHVAITPVLFDGGKPSNFYMAEIVMWCPLTGTYVKYRANEYYFQCAKTFRCNAPNMLKMHNKILDAPTCSRAKFFGRQVPLSCEELLLWDTQYAPTEMLACNLRKFYRHADCREWLVGTGNRPLVEHRSDPVWGDNMDGTGRNLLGKTLEVVRALVR